MTLVKINNRPVKTFDNLFNDLFAGLPNQWPAPQSAAVPVNILENNDGFHLEFSAPGRNKDEFKIELEKGLLVVGYEPKEVKDNADAAPEFKTVRREFTSGSFKRSFTIDDKVNGENIQARYENGILKIFLPKKEQVAPTVKQISVQ